MEDKNETVLWMPNGTQVKLVVDQSVIFSVFKKYFPVTFRVFGEHCSLACQFVCFLVLPPPVCDDANGFHKIKIC